MTKPNYPSKPADPSREAEIRARADAATPGPWFTGASILLWTVEGPHADSKPIARNLNRDDTEFIAHSREDIDYLLAENQRLRDQRDAAQMRIDKAVRVITSQSVVRERCVTIEAGVILPIFSARAALTGEPTL